jgi:hypothetical protein
MNDLSLTEYAEISERIERISLCDLGDLCERYFDSGVLDVFAVAILFGTRLIRNYLIIRWQFV